MEDTPLMEIKTEQSDDFLSDAQAESFGGGLTSNELLPVVKREETEEEISASYVDALLASPKEEVAWEQDAHDYNLPQKLVSEDDGVHPRETFLAIWHSSGTKGGGRVKRCQVEGVKLKETYDRHHINDDDNDQKLKNEEDSHSSGRVIFPSFKISVKFGPYKGKISEEHAHDLASCSAFVLCMKYSQRLLTMFEHGVKQRTRSHSVGQDLVFRFNGKDFSRQMSEYLLTDEEVEDAFQLAERIIISHKQVPTQSASQSKANADRPQGKKTHTCLVCNQPFANTEALRRHLIGSHSGVKPYQCEVCQKSFSRTDYLKSHIRTHTGEKPYDCEVCGKCFADQSTRRVHLRTHTGEKPHQCTVCGKSFPVLKALRRHLQSHTGEKPYPCELCEKSFASMSGLSEHTRTHTGEKPHQCKLCEKSFSRTSHLTSHMMIHNGEKPHSCQVCGKSFSKLIHLKYHNRIHTGEKPHQCATCQKSFTCTGSLNKHMRTHTGEKPHQCEVCQKTFARSHHLMRHIKTHTGEKPHQCAVCGKFFSRDDNLENHMKTHSVEKSQE